MKSAPSSLRSRAIVPSTIVLATAVLVSVLAHSSTYVGLGMLEGLLVHPRSDSSQTTEIEFIISDTTTSTTAPDEEEVDSIDETPPEDEVTEPEHERTRPRRERREQEREREREREPEPPEPPPTPAVAPPAPPAPLPPRDDRRAVQQQSQDPTQPPPPDAQFIADENNRVEEETVASITSATHDDVVVSPGHAETAPSETPGDSSERVVADMRDSEGSDARRPTPEEADRRDPRDATDRPSTSRQPRADATGTDATSDRSDRPEHGRPSHGDEGGARALGGATPTTEVMVSDGYGSYTIRVPVPQPPGTGGGTTGGHHRDGRGAGSHGRGRLAGRTGEEGGAPHEHGTGERAGPRLGLTFTDLESVYGEEEVERERHARLERRRSHTRGSSREEIWTQFRAAMENYIGEVRPGNQTALNAAASPFAHFLAAMHVRIHQEFAERYLASLGASPTDPLNDPSLTTTLEIAVNTDGSIHRVGILRSSGNTLYDLGAFTAVWRAQPYPRPPSIILSGDGHAWLHWTFERNTRQCGTWNAEPFLIDNGRTPPASTESEAVADEFLPDDDEGSGQSPLQLAPPSPVTIVPP